MQRITTAMLAVAAAAGAAGNAAGAEPKFGFLTAGELRERCEETSPGAISYCFAYLAAVHDSMRAYERWLHLREFCPPPETPQADLRRALVTYLDAHPTDRGGQAASVAVNAFKARFPCTP